MLSSTTIRLQQDKAVYTTLGDGYFPIPVKPIGPISICRITSAVKMLFLCSCTCHAVKYRLSMRPSVYLNSQNARGATVAVSWSKFK